MTLRPYHQRKTLNATDQTRKDWGYCSGDTSRQISALLPSRQNPRSLTRFRCWNFASRVPSFLMFLPNLFNSTEKCSIQIQQSASTSSSRKMDEIYYNLAPPHMICWKEILRFLACECVCENWWYFLLLPPLISSSSLFFFLFISP